jgi:hypothetical protein
MNKKDEARLGMVDTTIAFLTTNATTVATVPAFDALFTTLKTMRTDLEPWLMAAAKSTKGKTDTKTSLKELLCEEASDLAATVKSYAVSTGNLDLRALVDYSFSDLMRLKDEDLAPACKNIHDAVNNNIAALAAYNITPATLTAFDTLITSYTNATPGTRNAIIDRSVAIDKSIEGVKDIVALLKDQMDGIAVQFKKTDAEFYNAYLESRILVDAPTQKKEEPAPPAPPTT